MFGIVWLDIYTPNAVYVTYLARCRCLLEMIVICSCLDTCLCQDVLDLLCGMVVVCPAGSQQHYSTDSEPVWQPQYGSRLDSESSARGYPSVNGGRYIDDGYGAELDSTEPGFTQQQVNGPCFISDTSLTVTWFYIGRLSVIWPFWKTAWHILHRPYTVDVTCNTCNG